MRHVVSLVHYPSLERVHLDFPVLDLVRRPHTWRHIKLQDGRQTHARTHTHVWGGFRGIGYLAAKLGTWIIPPFHGVYSYDVSRNIAISRPKMCKKKLHNRYDFLPVTGGKIELSNNARWHPIACILPLDCLTSDFWIWGYPHRFWIPHLPEMKSVCVPENPPIHTRTHTHARTHTTHTRTHTHSHTHAHTHAPTQHTHNAHTRTLSHTHPHTHIYAHTSTRTHAHKHACTHTYTHTPIQPVSLKLMHSLASVVCCTHAEAVHI